MNTEEYTKFLFEHGIRIDEQIGATDRFTLLKSDALEAIAILRKSNIGLVGGDVYNFRDGKPDHARDAWSVDTSHANSDGTLNVARSLELATEYINKYPNVMGEHGTSYDFCLPREGSDYSIEPPLFK